MTWPRCFELLWFWIYLWQKLCKGTCSGHYKHQVIAPILLMYFEKKLNKSGPLLMTNLAHQTFAEMPVGTIVFVCSVVSSVFKFLNLQLIWDFTLADSSCIARMENRHQATGRFHYWWGHSNFSRPSVKTYLMGMDIALKMDTAKQISWLCISKVGCWVIFSFNGHDCLNFNNWED